MLDDVVRHFREAWDWVPTGVRGGDLTLAAVRQHSYLDRIVVERDGLVASLLPWDSRRRVASGTSCISVHSP
jgi:hypothetical protein